MFMSGYIYAYNWVGGLGSDLGNKEAAAGKDLGTTGINYEDIWQQTHQLYAPVYSFLRTYRLDSLVTSLRFIFNTVIQLNSFTCVCIMCTHIRSSFIYAE